MNRTDGAHVSRGRLAAREIAYVALGVALVSVSAWISVPLGSIPFTLQTLAVALLGALFGVRRSLAVIAVYILMGLIGIPVFSGFRAGAAALLGATGGYIFGFFFLALVPALFKLLPVKNKWRRAGMLYGAMALGMAVCYLFGTVWFVLVYECSVGYALTLCVLPYLVPDFIKFIVATLLAVRLEKFVK